MSMNWRSWRVAGARACGGFIQCFGGRYMDVCVCVFLLVLDKSNYGTLGGGLVMVTVARSHKTFVCQLDITN